MSDISVSYGRRFDGKVINNGEIQVFFGGGYGFECIISLGDGSRVLF